MKSKLLRNPDNIRFEPVQKYKISKIAELEDRPLQWQIRKFVKEKIHEWERKHGSIPLPERLKEKSEKS